MTPIVGIVTFCVDPQQLYGTLLTFQTIRRGFPTAQIIVLDNASLPAVRPRIRAEAEAIGAAWFQQDVQLPHAECIRMFLHLPGDAPLVMVDPDCIFWEVVENWQFPSALLAGRLLPTFFDTYTQCLTHERIHTSFAWFPDRAAFHQRFAYPTFRYFDCDPLRPVMLKVDERWQRWDTLAVATDVLEQDCVPLSEQQLDAYDHLFCGTHLPVVAPHLAPKWRQEWERIHGAVQGGDLMAAKGTWKLQDEFFKEHAHG